MPSAFSWPMLVPSSLRLPAPVNQGVRPLKSLHPAFHAHLWFKSLRGNLWESQLPDCAHCCKAAISSLWPHAASSLRPCVLWLLAVRHIGFVAAGTSCIAALPHRFPPSCGSAPVQQRSPRLQQLFVGASGALTRPGTRVSRDLAA